MSQSSSLKGIVHDVTCRIARRERGEGALNTLVPQMKQAGTIQTLPTRRGQYRPCPQGGDNTYPAHKAGTIQTLPTRWGQYRPCPQGGDNTDPAHNG